MFNSKLVLPSLLVLAALALSAFLFLRPDPPSRTELPSEATAAPAPLLQPPQEATNASGEASASPDVSASGSDSATDAESRLAEVFRLIESRDLDLALKATEALLEQHPNYRLAHLVRGDLLLARTHPIQAFGAIAGAPEAQIADLQAEALLRLRGYRDKPPADYIPSYLLRLRPDQRHAVIVDTERARLYLYENDKDGRPRFVADYYISQGKLGAEKLIEGDKKTPLGVYHVTADLSAQKLPDLYGNGAFPINYPNEWDTRQGRTGSGIWLHGTPSDTFSRPPLASDGCVVLTNNDLDSLRNYLQVGLTPVIISNRIEWISPDQWQQERDELSSHIEAWRADWESRDTERYLSHYSRQFKAGNQDFARFSAHKRQVNANKAWIKLGLDNIAIFRNPGREEVAVVTFDQDYRSDNLSNKMKKRQFWVREKGQWKIIYEGAG